MPDQENFQPPYDPQELDEIVTRLYERLRKIAAKVHWRGPVHSQPTSLVHQMYLRVRDGEGIDRYEDVIAGFCTVMRNILVDRARECSALKRGGGRENVPLVDDILAEDIPFPIEDFIDIGRAWDELKRFNPRWASVAGLRFFLGCTIQETAALLGISPATVEREWAKAKEFFSGRLKRGKADG